MPLEPVRKGKIPMDESAILSVMIGNALDFKHVGDDGQNPNKVQCFSSQFTASEFSAIVGEGTDLVKAAIDWESKKNAAFPPN